MYATAVYVQLVRGMPSWSNVFLLSVVLYRQIFLYIQMLYFIISSTSNVFNESKLIINACFVFIFSIYLSYIEFNMKRSHSDNNLDNESNHSDDETAHSGSGTGGGDGNGNGNNSRGSGKRNRNEENIRLLIPSRVSVVVIVGNLEKCQRVQKGSCFR